MQNHSEQVYNEHKTATNNVSRQQYDKISNEEKKHKSNFGKWAGQDW